MKFYFIINPKAGAGTAGDALKSAIDALPEKDDCILYETKSVGDACDFVRKTCEENRGEAMRFIACGGDGTVNEVFSGAVGFENVSVSVYPCGSGNDFVKVFGGAETFLNV